MALPRQQPPLWAQPVAQRPSRLWAALPLTAAFILLFDIGILTTFTALVLLLPLAYWRPTRLAYRRVGKKAFGGLLVLVVQLFSPTELVLTAGEGIDHDKWVEKDAEGTVSKVLLPAKGIWVRLRYIPRAGRAPAQLANLAWPCRFPTIRLLPTGCTSGPSPTSLPIRRRSTLP